MRKLAAALSLSVGLTATVPALAQDPFAPADPPAPAATATTAAPSSDTATEADPFAALPAAAPVNDPEPTATAPATAERANSEPVFTPPVFTPVTSRPASRDVAAPPAEQRPAWQAAPMPPAQTEPPVPFGQFVPVYEPNPPRTAAAIEPYRREHSAERHAEQTPPAADIVLPPRTARRQPHPADVIDSQARELIRQRELVVARQRIARIQYRKWHGISLLRPYVGDMTKYRPGASATPVQSIHFRSR